MAHPHQESDLELRLKTLKTGSWPTLLACSFAVVYTLMTWDHPHRTGLLVLVVAAAASAMCMQVVDVEPLVRRRPEAFFLSWTVSFVVVITIAGVLDGGSASPTTAMFVLPIAFCSLSYPTRSLLVAGAMNLGGYTVVALTGQPHPAEAMLFGSTLLTVTWICAGQTRNHDQRREELALVSRTDELTGTLNRRGFEERAIAALAEARRSGAEVGLVVIDLDGFKAVNDTRGHQAGDDILRRVGTALRQDLRAGDAVGRTGGDEFAVLLAGGVAGDALERLRARLAPASPASLGGATFPSDGLAYDELYRVADERLYERKRATAAAATAPPRS